MSTKAMSGRFCARCNHEMTRRQFGRGNLHCSQACRGAATRADPRPYDDTIRSMAATGRSWSRIAKACGASVRVIEARAHWLGVTKAPARSGSGTPYLPAQDAILRELYPSGTPFVDVQVAVNAVVGGYILRDAAQLGTWAKAAKVRRSPEYIRSLYEQRRRSAPVAAARPAVTERPPIQIHLREIYQHAFTLDLPRDKRGDLDALNRAMRRENPAHPGFVLADRKISRVGLYAR